MAILVDLQRATARISNRALFDELSFTVSDGDRVGVVGINGTGKSTLLRIVAGEAAPDSGRVIRGRGTRIGYLAQDPHLPPGRVLDAVGGTWEAEAILERLGMGAFVDDDVARLSGGQAKRVALARVLVQPCELLVLDEPTNHLDLAATFWLERRLAAVRGGLVIVSHDRHLLDRVATTMLELDRGSTYVHEGGYASYLGARVDRDERAASDEATRANLAKRELAWLRRGAPARTRKPQARIESALRVVNGRPEAPARQGALDLAFGTRRLGDKVIECRSLAFSYEGSDRPTVDGVDLVLDPRERLGLVGTNGSGKSTMLDLLAGRKRPTAGSIEVGPTVTIGCYDQLGVDIDPGARVRELVAGPTRVPGTPEDIALMERFWFTGELAFARAGTLSGGELKRLQLLLVLAQRPNVVLLDEPTNDLDLDTLRIVEDFFDDWPGALVIVSHDRTFLERTTERLVSIGPDGRLRPVAGGLTAYLETAAQSPTQRRSRPGSTATPRDIASPHLPSPSTLGRRLREVERDMVRLAERRDQLAAELAATTAYGELSALGHDLARAEADLADAENRWLALAEESEGRR